VQLLQLMFKYLLKICHTGGKEYNERVDIDL